MSKIFLVVLASVGAGSMLGLATGLAQKTADPPKRTESCGLADAISEFSTPDQPGNGEPTTRTAAPGKTPEESAEAAAIGRFKSLVTEASRQLSTEFKHMELISVSLDVQRSSSLISRFTGVVTIHVRNHLNREPKDDDDIGYEITDFREWNARYAYVDEQWQCIHVDQTITEYDERHWSKNEKKNASVLSLWRAVAIDSKRNLTGSRHEWEHEKLRDCDNQIVRLLRDAGE